MEKTSKEKSKPYSYAYFAFDGITIDIERISQELLLKPTKTRIRAEINQEKIHPKKSSWQLFTTPKKESPNLYKLSKELLKKLNGKESTINKIKKEQLLSTRLQFVIYIDSNLKSPTPHLVLNENTIDFLYKTNSITDFDIYILKVPN